MSEFLLKLLVATGTSHHDKLIVRSKNKTLNPRKDPGPIACAIKCQRSLQHDVLDPSSVMENQLLTSDVRNIHHVKAEQHNSKAFEDHRAQGDEYAAYNRAIGTSSPSITTH